MPRWPEGRGRSRQTSWLSLGSLSWVWRNAALRSLMLLFFLYDVGANSAAGLPG